MKSLILIILFSVLSIVLGALFISSFLTRTIDSVEYKCKQDWMKLYSELQFEYDELDLKYEALKFECNQLKNPYGKG